jgi:protein-S-isoprenylcysteine O-methyltransferase Ste14
MKAEIQSGGAPVAPEPASALPPSARPEAVSKAATPISAGRQLAGLPTLIFAQLGVLALVVGLGGYLWRHIFVLAYLAAAYLYTGADVLIRPPFDTAANRDTFQTKWGPLLQSIGYSVFAAAPFERTYFYSTDSPNWLGAVGFVTQLSGITIALIARHQLGSFGTPHLATQEQQHVIKDGLYGRVRHPLYSGGLLSSLAWPIIYGAPVTFALTFVYRLLMLRRRIKVEEAMMREKFGAEYETYAQATRRLIPGVY